MERVPLRVRDDGLIEVGIGTRDKDNLKLVPGARWKQAERAWTTPLTWAAFQQLRGVFGDRLYIDDTLKEMAWRVYKERVEPCMALRVAKDCEWVNGRAGGADYELEPLQRAAVGFMTIAQHAFEGDPMGSGKTPITICAIRELKERGRDVFPCLIVANNGAVVHWRNEFASWWPEVNVSVIQGNVKERREAIAADADVFVINWEGLKGHTRLAGYGKIRLTDKQKEEKELNDRVYRTLVVDEVHRGKDPKAQQTRACFYLADTTYAAGGNIFGLTGSLIANSPEDLWAEGHIVVPPEYPTKSTFVDRYALMSWGHFGGLKVVGLRGDTREEFHRILEPRHIRRPKELILPQLAGKLPPVTRTVDLSPKQKKAYKALKEEMLVQLEGGTLMASNPLAKMQRLRQLAGATGVVEEDGSVSLKEPSTKLDDLVEVLEELDGDSVVVYAESRLLIELAAARLAKVGIDAVQYTGKVDVAERELNRIAFQEGRAQVILCTYGAGAESINLSKADALVRLEFSWSAIKNSQALERPVRPGREGPLRVIDIVAVDTVDLDVKKAFGDKLEMLEEVVRDEETMRRWLS